MAKRARVAIVTGASRKIGIGAAVAHALARDGWNIATTCWRPYDATMPWGSRNTEAAALIRDLKKLNVKAAMCEDDLADPDAPARIFDFAERELGPATALVNVHAYSTRGSLMEVTVEEFDRHIAINSRGTLLMSREFAKRFRGPRGTGRIVNFTSGLPLTGEIAYAASKGAIEWITNVSAGELAPRGITVNAVDPGPTDSGWMWPKLKKFLKRESPLGRIGRPEDAAEVVAFLCSDRGGWITGQILHCDGGWQSLRD